MPAHVLYDPASENWDPYFSRQVGGAPYFEGVPYRRGVQRGAGLGALAAPLMQFLIPLARNVVQSVGHEGLAAGSRLLANLADGQSLRPALKTQAQTAFQNLVKKQQGKGKPRHVGHSLIGKRLRPGLKPFRSSNQKDPFDL
jgi:hypothetical protein